MEDIMNKEIKLIMNDKKILYKINILLWGQNKLMTIILNPCMRQVEIRDKWLLRKKIVDGMASKNLDNPLIVTLHSILDKKIYILSQQLINIPSKL
jgi:hypothetical protein